MGKLETTETEATEPTLPQMFKCAFRDYPIIRLHLGNAREASAAADIDTGNA